MDEKQKPLPPPPSKPLDHDISDLLSSEEIEVMRRQIKEEVQKAREKLKQTK